MVCVGSPASAPAAGERGPGQDGEEGSFEPVGSMASTSSTSASGRCTVFRRPSDGAAVSDPRDHRLERRRDEPDPAAVGFVLQLGRALHSSGYSAQRLEDSLGAIAERLGLTNHQFFSTPTSIMASFGPIGRQRTHLLRVAPGDVNLGRLAALEQVSMEVVEGRASLEDGVAAITRIGEAPAPYRPGADHARLRRGVRRRLPVPGRRGPRGGRSLGAGTRRRRVRPRRPATAAARRCLRAARRVSGERGHSGARPGGRPVQRGRGHARRPDRSPPRSHAHGGDGRAGHSPPRVGYGAPERRLHHLPGHRLRRSTGQPPGRRRRSAYSRPSRRTSFPVGPRWSPSLPRGSAS